MSDYTPSRSKLVEALQEAAGQSPRRIGFGIPEGRRLRRRVLVVALPEANSDSAEAARSAGADALLIQASIPAAARKELGRVVSSAGDLPCGLRIRGDVASAAVSDLISEGLDFVLASVDEAPPSFLALSVGKGLAVSHSLPFALIRGLSELRLDFVVLEPATQEERPARLTVRDMLALHLLAQGIRRPALLSSVYLAGPDEVAVLADLGINSLLLDAGQAGAPAKSLGSLVEQYRKALDAVESLPRGRRESDVLPVLPRSQPRVAPERELEEPDEE